MRVKANPQPEVVKVASFDLDKTAITGAVGTSTIATISNILPANATDKSIKFSIEDETVATTTEKNGVYTFNLLKEGTTKAHWVSTDGGAKADATITVSAAGALDDDDAADVDDVDDDG